MKNIVKGFLLSSLACLLLGQAPLGYAQSLNERREQLIYSLMTGTTKEFTQEEIEEYIKAEEIKVLETGAVGNISAYGIGIDHSTAQSMVITDNLQSYLTGNSASSDSAELYPFAVNFERLPAILSFYHVDDKKNSFADFEVTNNIGKISMYN